MFDCLYKYIFVYVRMFTDYSVNYCKAILNIIFNLKG